MAEKGGRPASINIGSILFTSFVCPCPEGHIVQHDNECWKNAIEFLYWIPLPDNYLKENLDPQ